ncbi:Xaa-Pro peptidase family protein [Nocardia sp. NPDC050697]|uniref:M24 family metallopeptidase n=1 Tax=Nocardia sp. NPDC050697 TaxID=3155158 RepID=UPI0033EEA167
MTHVTSTFEIPDVADRGRLRREVGARLRAAMTEHGVDALILLGNGAVTYATGTWWPLADAGLSHVERPVAVVLADDPIPHLFIQYGDIGPFDTGLPEDHLHPAAYLEFDEGVEQFARFVSQIVSPGATIAVDEMTGAMRRHAPLLFPAAAPGDAAVVVGAAKVIKTPDEIATLRTACRITDEAMVDVQAVLDPGIRQIDLSAKFTRRAFELGAVASMLEPIWQVMPHTKAEGVWTTHGDLALPLLSTERELAAGDVLWTDVSINYNGYCSDFGRTWLVGQEPTRRQQAQFERWWTILNAVLDVTRAGSSLADLSRAAITAAGGVKPWLPHFYLGHSIGVQAGEMPMIGTDLGDEHDENYLLRTGMVLVLEPVVWEDGTGGYRSEEIVVVTDDGYIALTDYPYAPYGPPSLS